MSKFQSERRIPAGNLSRIARTLQGIHPEIEKKRKKEFREQMMEEIIGELEARLQTINGIRSVTLIALGCLVFIGCTTRIARIQRDVIDKIIYQKETKDQVVEGQALDCGRPPDPKALALQQYIKKAFHIDVRWYFLKEFAQIPDIETKLQKLYGSNKEFLLKDIEYYDFHLKTILENEKLFTFALQFHQVLKKFPFSASNLYLLDTAATKNKTAILLKMAALLQNDPKVEITQNNARVYTNILECVLQSTKEIEALFDDKEELGLQFTYPDAEGKNIEGKSFQGRAFYMATFRFYFTIKDYKLNPIMKELVKLGINSNKVYFRVAGSPDAMKDLHHIGTEKVIKRVKEIRRFFPEMSLEHRLAQIIISDTAFKKFISVIPKIIAHKKWEMYLQAEIRNVNNLKTARENCIYELKKILTELLFKESWSDEKIIQEFFVRLDEHHTRFSKKTSKKSLLQTKINEELSSFSIQESVKLYLLNSCCSLDYLSLIKKIKSLLGSKKLLSRPPLTDRQLVYLKELQGHKDFANIVHLVICGNFSRDHYLNKVIDPSYLYPEWHTLSFKEKENFMTLITYLDISNMKYALWGLVHKMAFMPLLLTTHIGNIKDFISHSFIQTLKEVKEKTNTRIHFADLGYILFLSQNPKEKEKFLGTDPEKLKRKLYAELSQFKHLGRSAADGGNYREDYTQVKEEKFGLIQMVKISTFLQALKSKKFQKAIVKKLQEDVGNVDTEFGGLIFFGKDGKVSIEFYKPKGGSDNHFTAPLSMLKNVPYSQFDFHFHAVGQDGKWKMNILFAGPSGGDLSAAQQRGFMGMVFTFTDKNEFNVDIYTPKGRVLDLMLSEK